MSISEKAMPDWAGNTPQHVETQYLLQIFEPQSIEEYPQSIDLTREEYIFLKGRLVERRGPVPEAAPPQGEPLFSTKEHWSIQTPDECCYQICMYDEHGGSIQPIGIAREEYESLKAILACMRLVDGDYYHRFRSIVEDLDRVKADIDALHDARAQLDVMEALAAKYGPLLAHDED